MGFPQPGEFELPPLFVDGSIYNVLYWTRAYGLLDGQATDGTHDIAPAIQNAFNAGYALQNFPNGNFLWNTPVYHNGYMPLRLLGAGSSQNANAPQTRIILGDALAGADVDHCDIALRIHEVAGAGTTVRGVYEHTFGTEVGGGKNDETNHFISGIFFTSSAAAQALAYLPSFCLGDDVGVWMQDFTFDHLLMGLIGVRYADGMRIERYKIQNGKRGTDPTHVSLGLYQSGLGDNVGVLSGKGGSASCVFYLGNSRGLYIGPTVGGGGKLYRSQDFTFTAFHFDADDTSSTTTQFVGWLEISCSQGRIGPGWYDSPWNVLANVVPVFAINDINAGEPSDVIADSVRGNITLDSTRQGGYRIGDYYINASVIGTALRLRHNMAGGFEPTLNTNAIGPMVTCNPTMTALAAQVIDPAFQAQIAGDVDMVVEFQTSQSDATFTIRGAGGHARAMSALTLPTLVCEASSLCPNSLGANMLRNYTGIAIDGVGRACGYVTVTGDSTAFAAWSNATNYNVGAVRSISGQSYIAIQQSGPGHGGAQQPDISPTYWSVYYGSVQLDFANLACRPHSLVVLSADGNNVLSQTAATRWATIPVGFLSSIPAPDIGVSIYGIPWITTGTIPKIADYFLDSPTRNWAIKSVLGKSIFTPANANGKTVTELMAPISAIKTVDESRTTNVLAVDTDLQLWLPVGKYKIDATLKYDGEKNASGSSGEFQIGFVTQAGRAGFYNLHGLITTVTTSGGSQQRASNAWGSQQGIGAAGVSGAPVPLVATVEGELTVTTPGPIQLEWAQNNASAAPTTLYTGSVLVATPL